MTLTSKKQLGDRGEALVVQWLQRQGWAIVAQQWHCRWGELDIVAQHPQVGLAFVEVKTRRSGSLDQGGRLAITPKKQKKLWHSAQLFLTEHIELGELPCRFDVALVAQGPLSRSPSALLTSPTPTPLALVEYIDDAFQVS